MPSRPATTLTPRQERFVSEYLLDDNAAGAYARAGYAASTPQTNHVNASRLLRSATIQAALAARRAQLEIHAQITRQDLLDQLMAIAFADPRDVMAWGPAGVRLQESSALTREQASTVSEVSETPGRHGRTVRVKRESRLEAIDLIAKMLGYYPKGPLVDNRTMNVFSADAAIRALLEARQQLAAQGEVNRAEAVDQDVNRAESEDG